MKNKKIVFSPSLMCMDLLKVEEQIQILNSHFDTFHIDIMDGHFCDSIHLSPSFVAAISKVSKLPIEVHLMVDNPEKFIYSLIDKGADTIILHAETITTRAFRLVNEIHGMGKKVGIALCPITPFDSIKYLINDVDMVTILAVDAGFKGQPIINSTYNKISYASKLKNDHKYKYIIQCDGGVEINTYKILYNLGVDSFVLGEKALFGKSTSIDHACNIMKKEFCCAINK